MGQAELMLQELANLAKRAEIGRDIIMQSSMEPNQRREPPIFTASRAADLLGRSRHTVTRAIQELKLGTPTGDAAQTQYHLAQRDLIALAGKFGLRPDGPLPTLVVSIINQKGGVAKTTTAIHLAHYLALFGYRVGLIDADSQASATAYMGVNPDVEVDESETLFNILTGESEDLAALMRPAPHFSNLSYVPACLSLSVANELAFAKQARGEKSDFVFFNRLAKAIQTVRADIDVLIIDCPPHISPATYNAIYASDVALVPTSASMLDLASTLRFIGWVKDITPMLPGLNVERIKFLATNFDSSAAKAAAAEQDEEGEPGAGRRRPFAAEGLDLMRQILGQSMLRNFTVRSTEVQRAGSLLRSIYESTRPLGSRDAWTRACATIDGVNREILDTLEEVWSLRASVQHGA